MNEEMKRLIIARLRKEIARNQKDAEITRLREDNAGLKAQVEAAYKEAAEVLFAAILPASTDPAARAEQVDVMWERSDAKKALAASAMPKSDAKNSAMPKENRK